MAGVGVCGCVHLHTALVPGRAKTILTYYTRHASRVLRICSVVIEIAGRPIKDKDTTMEIRLI